MTELRVTGLLAVTNGTGDDANHPDEAVTFNAMANLAESYRIHMRNAEALRLDEEAVRLRRLKQGPEHPETLRHSGFLANDYMIVGLHKEGFQLMKQVNALLAAKLGPEHPITLESLGHMAGWSLKLGENEEALRLYQEIVRRAQAKYGAQHPRTPWDLNRLSACYYIMGRHAEALTARQEALRLRQARLGPDHTDTILSTWAVAESLTALDRDEEATPLVEDSLKRAAGKPQHESLAPELLRLRLRLYAKTNNVAKCLETAQRLDELKASDAHRLYMSACGRALCAGVIQRANPGAPEQADLAMAHLTAAVAAGFTDVVRIKREKDLDPLRGRPDFSELIADLEKRIAK